MFGNVPLKLSNEDLKMEVVSSGIAKDFVEKAYGSQKELWYPSAEELKRAGFVTDILPTE
jgi:hypothetical protein